MVNGISSINPELRIVLKSVTDYYLVGCPLPFLAMWHPKFLYGSQSNKIVLWQDTISEHTSIEGKSLK